MKVLLWLIILAAAALVALNFGGGYLAGRQADQTQAVLFKQARRLTVSPRPNLPPVVKKYLDRAAPAQMPKPAKIMIRQQGLCRLRPDQGFSSFKSVQAYTTSPPGFVWSADMSYLPGVSLRTLDWLIGRRAVFSQKWFGLVKSAQAAGPEMAASSLIRYLAEAVWFPQALRPTDRLTWEAIDSHSARAKLTAAGVTVGGVFSFDDQGRVIAFRAERRRLLNGRLVATPWLVEYAGHDQISGEEVPLICRASWQTPQGKFTYRQIKLLDIKIAE